MADIPLELQPDLPATPMSLLALSQTFDRYGYHKLARHLRAAADSMSAVGRTEVHAVLTAAKYDEHVAGSRYGVTLKGADAAVHDVRLGQRYALVPLPAEVSDERQQQLQNIGEAVMRVGGASLGAFAADAAGGCLHDDDRR